MNNHQQQAQDFADSLRTIQAVEENIQSNEQGMRDQYQHKSGLQSEQGSWMAVEDADLPENADDAVQVAEQVAVFAATPHRHQVVELAGVVRDDIGISVLCLEAWLDRLKLPRTLLLVDRSRHRKRR